MIHGKSLEKVPIIEPGIYPGLWSAYFVQIVFANGRTSEKIAVDEGVRGVNCKCSVTIDEEGQLTINDYN